MEGRPGDVPNNEDKYRDIYKISEVLKKYPDTEAKFALEKQKIVDAEIVRQQQFEQQQKEEADSKLKEEMLKPEKQKKREAREAIAKAESIIFLKKADLADKINTEMLKKNINPDLFPELLKKELVKNNRDLVKALEGVLSAIEKM